MDRINLGVVGTGWCGAIRAEISKADDLITIANKSNHNSTIGCSQ